MKNFTVIANWKMHGNSQSLLALAEGICAGLPISPLGVSVGVCPPFVYLASIYEAVSRLKSSIALGAQDVSQHASGAYTGQVCAEMLQDLGCTYVIVGHSERRHGCGESSLEVAVKARRALEVGLTPIVCVGELLEEREANRTFQVLASQLEPIFELEANLFKRIIIAYEPVWAIGTGKSASPEQAQEIHHWIRKELVKRVQDVGQSLPILYGGSVKPENALELFQCPDINGGLIGGASLDVEAFVSICKSAFNLADSIIA